MQIEDLKNLSQNNKLREKIEKILSMENENKKYRASQVILEYINAYFLTQNKKINLSDYNIMKIILAYQNIDDDLYNTMLDVNALYNKCDEDGVTEDRVERLLLKIDNIYGIIKNKYGDIE